jgi:hypothetical protein
VLAPGHQRLTRKAGVGSQQDANPRPPRPDLPHEARHLLHSPSTRVDVGAAQRGREQVPATEDVERQIAVAVVVAVKEPAFLVAMDRVIGRVQVQDDLLGWARMCLQKQVPEHARNRLAIMADAVIARGLA